MTTTVTFLGQASVEVASQGVSIATDPWFSSSSQLTGWLPYPRPSQESAARARSCRYIFISHDHEDHYDPDFLRTVPDATLIVPRFHNRGFLDSIATRCGHLRRLLLADGETAELAPGFRITVYMEKPLYRTNSVCVLDTPDGAILNANDCGFDRTMLEVIRKRHAPRVMLYTMNFAANAYPACFLRRTDVHGLREAMEGLKRDHLAKFDDMFETVGAVRAYAYAGPITFRAPFNAALNADPDLVDWRPLLARSVHRDAYASLQDGDRVVLDAGGVRDAPNLAPRTPYGGHATAASRSSEADLTAATAAFFDELSAIFTRLGRTPGSGLRLRVVADGTDPTASPAEQTHERAFDGSTTPTGWLTITADRDTLMPFLANQVSYDTLQLSQLAYFERTPDVHDALLHDVLKYCRDDWGLEAYAEHRRTTPGTFRVALPDGSTRDVPDRCPHEGEPLDARCVDGKRLVCPRHRWTFDLDTGACVKGGRCNLYGDRP